MSDRQEQPIRLQTSPHEYSAAAAHKEELSCQRSRPHFLLLLELNEGLTNRKGGETRSERATLDRHLCLAVYMAMTADGTDDVTSF